MVNLIDNSAEKLDTTYLVRVGDLSYFEGPLLSLFQELKSGHFYVFDWVDRDLKSNRWIIYRVSPKYLLQFIYGKISHLGLFQNRPDDTLFFTDIDSNNKSFYHYEVSPIKDLPNKYIPNKDNYFEVSDCIAFEKIESVVIDSLSRQNSENEYSGTYRPHILKRAEIKSIYSNKARRGFKAVPYNII